MPLDISQSSFLFVVGVAVVGGLFIAALVAPAWADQPDFARATGHESHGIVVDYGDFVKASPPNEGQTYAPQEVDLRLRQGSRAVDAGVSFTPGRPFFVDGGGERTLRLSFSSVPGRRIDEGVKRLAETIRAAMKRPRTAGADRAPVPVV